MTKLQSSTNYRFRLIAENELGRSRTSEIVAFQTQGTAPPKPQPPGLKEATKSSLHLVWSKRLTDSVSFSHREKKRLSFSMVLVGQVNWNIIKF